MRRFFRRSLRCAFFLLALLLAFAVPALAAPFSFTYSFTNEATNVSGGVLQEDGTFMPGTYFQRRASDGSFYTSGSTVAYLDVRFALESSLSVTLQQGQVLTSDATGDQSDDSSAFRLYCEGSQGQSLAAKAKTILFRLLDTNGAVLGSASSTVQRPNANYIYAPVPKFNIDRSGVVTSISCIIELDTTFSGDVRVFFAGRTWSFTLTSPGDPANPDYTSPDQSQLDDYLSGEADISDKISGGLDTSKGLFTGFATRFQILLNGLTLFTSAIGRFITAFPELQSLLYLGLALGISGFIIGIVGMAASSISYRHHRGGD